MAKKLTSPSDARSRAVETVPASSLKIGDIVLVEVNDLMPGDGEVVEGVASVNESAITGESRPGDP